MNNLELFIEYWQTLSMVTQFSIWGVLGIFNLLYTIQLDKKHDSGFFGGSDGLEVVAGFALFFGGLIAFGVGFTIIVLWKLTKILVKWLG